MSNVISVDNSENLKPVLAQQPRKPEVKVNVKNSEKQQKLNNKGFKVFSQY